MALAIRKSTFVSWLRGALSALRALPETLRKRRAVAGMSRIGSEHFVDLLRFSEREIYRWHNARPRAARSTLLNLYFRLFRCE